MPKYTKYLEFSQKERTAIRERDNYRCIFCQIGYAYHHRVSEFMDNYSSVILTWQMETEVEADGNA